jgi:hypothetical protein
MDRHPAEIEELTARVEPLRERLPVYARLFAMGAVACLALGSSGWLFLGLPGRIGREVALPLLRAVFGAESVGGVAWGPLGGVVSAAGYACIILGTVLLLTGGARGGGHTGLGVGAIEALVGGRDRSQDDFEGDAEARHGRIMKRRDPMERLRKGLRPGANPTAFWQSVAGFGYLGVGLAAITIFS